MPRSSAWMSPLNLEKSHIFGLGIQVRMTRQGDLTATVRSLDTPFDEATLGKRPNGVEEAEKAGHPLERGIETRRYDEKALCRRSFRLPPTL